MVFTWKVILGMLILCSFVSVSCTRSPLLNSSFCFLLLEFVVNQYWFNKKVKFFFSETSGVHQMSVLSVKTSDAGKTRKKPFLDTFKINPFVTFFILVIMAIPMLKGNQSCSAWKMDTDGKQRYKTVFLFGWRYCLLLDVKLLYEVSKLFYFLMPFCLHIFISDKS